MQPAGLVDIATGQLTQRHHPQTSLVADQDDASGQLANALQQGITLLGELCALIKA
ncbi:hypothetical protein D3C81_2317330 [compost metagenome]